MRNFLRWLLKIDDETPTFEAVVTVLVLLTLCFWLGWELDKLVWSL